MNRCNGCRLSLLGLGSPGIIRLILAGTFCLSALAAWPGAGIRAGEKFTNFENADLIAARLEGYRALDVDGVPVASSPLDETRPALASAGDGRLLLVYEKRLSDGRVRAVGRLLQTEP